MERHRNYTSVVYTHDALGRLVAQADPVSGPTLYTYTATELALEQDPRGQVTSYQYDQAGRQVLATDPLGDTTQQSYDQDDNTVALTTSSVGAPSPIQVENRQYDALDRAVTDTLSAPSQPPSSTVSSYDPDGDVAQVQQPNGDVVFNSYDRVDQLTHAEIDTSALSSPLSTTQQTQEQFSYDAAGNQTQSVDFSGRTHTTSYDGDSRALQSTDSYSGSSTIAITTTSSSFDPDGTIITQTQQTPNRAGGLLTHTYTATVNAADWTMSTGDTQPTGLQLVTGYGYDGAGQQRSQTVLDSGIPVTDDLNAEGLVTATVENFDGTGPYASSFGYDPDDDPITATLPGGVQENQGYDNAGRLSTVALSTTATGRLSNTYSYGYNPADWTTAATGTVSGSPTTDAYTHDKLGRLIGVSGSDGSSQSPVYDVNGNLLTRERGA